MQKYFPWQRDAYRSRSRRWRLGYGIDVIDFESRKGLQTALFSKIFQTTSEIHPASSSMDTVVLAWGEGVEGRKVYHLSLIIAVTEN
jgi:hypothetical protein